jgi:hypothetical protein
MAWVLRLIETGADGQGHSIDVLEIGRPDTLHDIADLGLTPPEAKRLLKVFALVDVLEQNRPGHAVGSGCQPGHLEQLDTAG